MKKAASILFLVSFFLATTNASEFFKLSTLIKHFTEHKAADPGLSLSTFIIVHYINDDGNNANSHEGMKLPFKNLATQCYNTIALAQPVALIIFKPQTGLIIKAFRLQNLAVPTDNFTHNIWQPPRT